MQTEAHGGSENVEAASFGEAGDRRTRAVEAQWRRDLESTIRGLRQQVVEAGSRAAAAEARARTAELEGREALETLRAERDDLKRKLQAIEADPAWRATGWLRRGRATG